MDVSKPVFFFVNFRSFNEGSLKVDNVDYVNGTSAEGSKGLNLDRDSNIFIGMQNCIHDFAFP